MTRASLPAFDFADRRARVLDRLDGGIAVFRAPSPVTHHHDVEHRYRREADFFYLTGFPEADAVAVLDASADREKFVLFVPPKDPERETWTGRRHGVEGALVDFGADAAYPIDELEQHLVPMIAGSGPLHFRFGREDAFDRRMLGMAKNAWSRRPRTANDIPLSIIDPGPIVHEMRLHKTPDELAWMRVAIDVAAEAHVAAMRAARPGVGEHEIEALIEYTFRRRGAEGWAYPSIVASGHNATVLHYVSNDRILEPGELLLVDAGAEFGGYCADVTRTFPVDREPSREQRDVYEVVLEAQLAAIAAVGPGRSFESVHDAAVEVLVDGLRRLGVLDAERERAIADGHFKPFYMHRTSHWLGMDVHDVGAYRQDGGSRLLAPGMVLTVEPGLYFSPAYPDVPERYRGIGVRIEDDVLVTADGCEVLSAAVPKQLDDMLALKE
ncbi:aminopeptidase P N-terminal domain-containing protein [bacterium]|nr:aminopeptidase P N-terminal domain-containing protein [bacterium]